MTLHRYLAGGAVAVRLANALGHAGAPEGFLLPIEPVLIIFSAIGLEPLLGRRWA